MQTILFCALYNISTDQIYGEGIELPFGIKITTDNAFKEKIIWKGIEGAIGGLEYNYLFNVPVLYKIENIVAKQENKDDILCDFLADCNFLLYDLWQIKDNAVDIQMGYLFYPFKMQSSHIQTLTRTDLINGFTHSNLISTTFTDFKGTKDTVHFSSDELKQIYQFDINRKTERFSKQETKKTLIRSSEQKITLAGIFIQMARTNHDLALKITLCCTALESLFTTDNKELSHKTAERASLLIGESLEERKIIYEKIRDIYAVRSQVLHGTALGKKIHSKIEHIAIDCDDLLRRIYKKINDTPELDKFYRNDTSSSNSNQKKETLDEYFLNKLFK